jgi:hypothetical protein
MRHRGAPVTVFVYEEVGLGGGLPETCVIVCASSSEGRIPALVIIDELNSSLFERCLDPDQCRNIACDCLTAFFLSVEWWPSPPRGLSNVSTTMAPIRIRHKEGFHDQRIGTTSSAVLRLVGNICCNDGVIERRPELGPRIR